MSMNNIMAKIQYMFFMTAYETVSFYKNMKNKLYYGIENVKYNLGYEHHDQYEDIELDDDNISINKIVYYYKKYDVSSDNLSDKSTRQFRIVPIDVSLEQLCFLKWRRDSFVKVWYKCLNTEYIFVFDEKTRHLANFLINEEIDVNIESDILNNTHNGDYTSDGTDSDSSEEKGKGEEEIDDFFSGILFATDTTEQKDITHLVKKYAGPDEDFYRNIGVKFKKEWIFFDNDIEITNKMANVKTFKDGDIITL